MIPSSFEWQLLRRYEHDVDTARAIEEMDRRQTHAQLAAARSHAHVAATQSVRGNT